MKLKFIDLLESKEFLVNTINRESIWWLGGKRDNNQRILYIGSHAAARVECRNIRLGMKALQKVPIERELLSKLLGLIPTN